MNIRRILTGMLCILIWGACALDLEDEQEEYIKEETSNESENNEDPTATAYAWEGELEKFTLHPKKGIQLTDPTTDSGTAFLSFASSSITNTCWEMGVKLSFNPSVNNFARFYLSASDKDLNLPQNGYYLQFGGKKDLIALYRQEGEQAFLLIEGHLIMEGDPSPELFIRVQCDASGKWSLWTRNITKEEEKYRFEGSATDCRWSNGSYAGIYCVYTPSRKRGFNFHHIQVSALTDNPQPIVPDVTARPYRKLLFNELMYQPAPDGAAYIELYNPGDEPLVFASLKLISYMPIMEDTNCYQLLHETILAAADGEPMQIPPHGYVCLTSSPERLRLKHTGSCGTCIEVKEFPKLLPQKGYIILTTNTEPWQPIDVCLYNDSMHSEGKAAAGVSLERRDDNADTDKVSWHSSTHPSGGSPGTKNF